MVSLLTGSSWVVKRSYLQEVVIAVVEELWAEIRGEKRALKVRRGRARPSMLLLNICIFMRFAGWKRQSVKLFAI